jgi:hypothetical protein
MYIYLGPSVASPAFSSLPTKWAKATYGIALPNFLIAGSLYSHTAAKLFFIRMFRKTRHLHHHTFLGWSTWILLIILANGAAFVLAVGVPIFSYLVSIAASLFASWYTYGIAGAFWLFDAWHGLDTGRMRGIHGIDAWKGSPVKTAVNMATFLAGAFICVAGKFPTSAGLFSVSAYRLPLPGTYVSIKLIIDAYNSGTVGAPFAC